MSFTLPLSAGDFNRAPDIRISLYPGESGPASYTESGSGGAALGGGAADTFFSASVGGGALLGGSVSESFDSVVRETSGGALLSGSVAETFFDATVGGGILLGGSADQAESGSGGIRVSGFATYPIDSPSDVEMVYSIFTGAKVQIELPWRTNVRSAYEFTYGILNTISKQVELAYDISSRSPVVKAVTLQWSMRLQAAVSMPYSIRPIVRNAVSMGWGLNSTVRKAVEMNYKLMDKNRVLKAFTAIWSMPDVSVVNVTDQPVLYLNGSPVRLLSGDISISEGGYAWEGNFTLADVRDYVQFRRDDVFTADLYGEVWTFIVDGKELRRDAPASVSCRIIGISPSARYVSPRAEKKDYEWDVVVSAQDAVTEVFGVSPTWDIVDWDIPAYRLAFTGADPMDILKRVAEAAGGVVESGLDGSLRVRPKYLVSPEDYPTTTAAHTYVELTDIVDVAESYNYGVVANLFRLMDVQASLQDNIEWIADGQGAYSGTVRVYPSPWRTNVELVHTADPTELQIGPQVVLYREESELIEIYKGQGSTQYPVYEILSVVWEATDLGGLAHDLDSREVFAVGPASNSLVRVTYRTRSLNYRASTSSGRPAQFLLESPQTN